MRNLLLVSALCLGVSAAGHADSVFTLVNNTYEGGGVATGTVNIDTMAGTFTSVNIDVQLGGTDYVFTGTPDFQSSFDSNSQYFEYRFDANGDALTIDLPVSTLVGYAGGTVCSYANRCGTPDELAMDPQVFYIGELTLADNTQYGALTGSLASTPEPSSVILLGTGLLAAAGAVRRKIFSHAV